MFLAFLWTIDGKVRLLNRMYGVYDVSAVAMELESKYQADAANIVDNRCCTEAFRAVKCPGRIDASPSKREKAASFHRKQGKIITMTMTTTTTNRCVNNQSSNGFIRKLECQESNFIALA